MATLTTVSEVAGTQPLVQERIAQELNVGTRKSALALIQTDMVVKALLAARPDYRCQIKARDTAAGDIDKVTPFKDMPVKNLWTHELETLMVEGSLDILVHSLKGRLLCLLALLVLSLT
jgi:porphobilinogen deaminase